MTPVIPCSVSHVMLIPGTTFLSRKNNHITRCNLLRSSSKHPSSSLRFLLPLSPSRTIFTNYGKWSSMPSRSRTNVSAATETEVTIEESASTVANEVADGNPEIPPDAVEESEVPASTASSSTTQTARSKRSRSVRKSEMPPVKNEELVPGATFTGKVRSIQPFGAFVDFGAFTDGLLHVSQLSDSFVNDVGSVVSIGQEVKVKLLEANTENGRISLTMREGDGSSKVQQQQKESPARASGDKRRNTTRSNQKRSEAQKSSKFVKGQVLNGTVKNMNRAGAFISLPEGEEGFLPTSEESDDELGNIMGRTSLQVGQEVSVRVLRITRGQVTLTMKSENVEESGTSVIQGMVHVATNPFVLAFRKNKDIADFLDQRENMQKPTEASVVTKGSEEKEEKVERSEILSGVVDDVLEDDTNSSEIKEEVNPADTVIGNPPNELQNEDESAENTVSSSSQSAEIASENAQEEENLADNSVLKSEVSEQNDTPSLAQNDEKVGSIPTESTVNEEVADDVVVKDEVVEQVNETPSAASNEDEKVEPVPVQSMTSEEIVESDTSNVNVKDGVPEQANEMPSVAQNEEENVESVLEKNSSITTSSEEPDVPSSKNTETKASISPALVKQLREETGAGMMDCKKALAETGGDIVKAQEFLRKKGLASADKKASRATAEGRIGSYIHDSRIGVLIEVNCETDFVSRGDIFKELVDDLAMQVAACPRVKYLNTDDVPEEIVNKERDIEMQKEDLLSKPEQIRAKIVDGRIWKRLAELALLEQPYIKNDKVVVKDWVKQTIATIGENIKVTRFERYNLGEGLEKKSQDFAAEVAAQTAAKSSPPPIPTDQPVAAEAKESVDKAPTVAISAALVKQLREETGAGMMDCKKALAETGGNIEKAQEYLRKKGLSTADKKSSRLAAEGRIGSYIHDSRIGVLIEVNCETDFVGRSEKFKELVDDLAMQVVACPQVQHISIEDVPESIVSKEKELEMQREDLLSKPENIREKIVEGRVSKRLGELTLLEQPFIKNDGILVKDLVKQTVAALGENIKVRRFVRFTLGETVEEA